MLHNHIADKSKTMNEIWKSIQDLDRKVSKVHEMHFFLLFWNSLQRQTHHSHITAFISNPKGQESMQAYISNFDNNQVPAKIAIHSKAIFYSWQQDGVRLIQAHATKVNWNYKKHGEKSEQGNWNFGEKNKQKC